MKKIFSIRIMFTVLVLMLFMGLLSGCQKMNFIPGASYGYFIWEEGEKIYISWSIDRKDASFTGSIKTDGSIDNMNLIAWEEEDGTKLTGNTLSYTANLGVDDYTDGLVLEMSEYEYIEFDLRINDGYDLSRVHVGAFLKNPENSPFRIGSRYFDEVKSIPWYEKNPFSVFFYKLFANKYFTFLFLFIIGVVVVEILRVTVFSGKRLKKLYTGISYIILMCLGVVLYFTLRYFVL